MRFVEHRSFKRQYKKLPSEVRGKVGVRLGLLVTDEFSPLLNNHKLHHPYEGHSTINITGDIRLIYKKIGPETLSLRAIGTHHQLFGT